MDPFREFYISSIIPQLKKIEVERKTIEKRLYRTAIIYILILSVIVVFLFVRTHNFNVVYIFFSIPIPFVFFSKDLINNYSKKYKETVIKNLFLSYFDNYVINTEKRSQFIKLKDSGFISNRWKINIDSEDFITLTFKGNKIYVQEVLVKQGKKILFKGVLCSLDLKRIVNQNLIIINKTNNNLFKYLTLDDLRTLTIKDINVFYRDSFDEELTRPFIDFVSNNHVALSIQNDKLHCLFPSDRIVIDEKMEMFEPILTTKFNSNDTFRFIRDEYSRISKISRLLLKLEEINMA